MTDLGLTRISPFTLGETIHRHIVSPLRQRARLRIFAAEKQVITLKKIWIMKRTLLAIAAAIVMITSANAQRLTNIQAEASFITDKMMVELGLSKAHREQHPEHKPLISQRHKQLSRHRCLWMAIPQQTAKAYNVAKAMEKVLRVVLLLPSHQLA